MIMIEHFPIDLVIEILCRLPVKSLIVFKCVSKTWNKHISHVCLPKISPDVSILFLYSGWLRTRIDSFCYTECGGLSYPPFPIETDEKYLELDSCNGLVLFKTYKTFSHVIDSRYIVANATTKQCFVIPKPLGYDRANDAVLAFDPFQSSHYKIILPRNVSNSMSSVVEIFSSETGKWARHILPIKLPTAQSRLIKKTVCLDGTLYMLSTKKCLIRLNLKSVTVEAIEVPCWDRARKRGLIAVSNGSLCYANYDEEFRLLIWQFDYYSTTDSSWILKHRICLHDLMDKHLMASWHRRMKRYPRESHRPAYEAFGIHPTANVIYLGNGMHGMRIFTYHLEKRELNFLWESEHRSFNWRENYVHPYSCSHIMASDFSKIGRKASKLNMDKDAPNSSSSPSKVYAFWKDFDLEKEKLDISEKRKKLEENKEKSIRKQKIWGVGSADQEATSAGATSDEASAKATSLLLDYKSEVNRADEAEKAFIELSDKICKAVDPFPFLYICRDGNKRIKWDFSEVKPQEGFEVLYDDSKEKEPRFLRDYIVEQSLGQGGFGEVFECQKRIDKHKYAVKKIQIEDNEKQESILSEVYALSGMQHRNIIRYYDAWIEPYGDDSAVKGLKRESSRGIFTATPNSSVDPNSKALYIQMSVCDKIASKITKVTALKYMRQITDGLHYLHQNEVVHGDLSSMNVLVDELGNAIIADFGLAVIPNLPNWDKEGSDWISEGGDWTSEGSDQEDDNQGGNQVGNPLYLAPERRKSKGIPLAPSSPKSDIYSLGVIFVELIAGFLTERPEFDRVRWILKAKSGAESGKLFDEIPMDDHPLLLKMLSSNPQDRPSTREVLEQLDCRRA